MAEIIGFAACWLLVASLMLWGVFTEHKRGERAVPSESRLAAWHPSRGSRSSQGNWVVVEVSEGGTPEVGEQARFLAGAWLAARGIEIDSLPPADVRTEVTIGGDGVSSTRVVVRAAALHTSRKHR
ncbi:MAG: hypothetical protein ACRDYY_04750 [Acidimicrobiales bacterium]